MENALILETSFLIDFERERLTGSGPTLEFLRAHATHRLLITHTIAGELASGVSLENRSRWEAFIRPFRILEWTTEVDREYGRLFRYLKSQGRLIGSNDLWISATALVYGYPVVTHNSDHFKRVPDLRVIGYR
jgi:predicted nucleic acid-binding protein